MKQVELIQEISNLFIQFSTEVKDKGKLKLNDINIVAEDVLVPILSIVYDSNLKNLNDEKSNYPGIDLATDEHITFGNTDKKIAFQITSTNSVDKIKKTLNAYIKGDFHTKFDNIYIYNLIEKQNSYSKASIAEITKLIDGKFNFDLNKNIIDKTDLQKKIKTLSPISKIEQIHKLLEDQFKYHKKSLLSLEIWESEGKLGYGFSNLINSIDLTTFQTLIANGISNDAKDLLQLLLIKYNEAFAKNYRNEKINVFKNLGFNSYLKAGLEQSLKSFSIIKNEINENVDIDLLSNELSKSFIDLNINLSESDFPLVNDPIDHPAIQFIKATITQIFTTAGISEFLINLFIKDFNENINIQIIETFGEENYAQHLVETNEKWIRENEKKFLIHIKNLAKLGFVVGEELEYQETYGTWQDVRQYGTFDEDSKSYLYQPIKTIDKVLIEIEKRETKLKPVEELINEYFDSYKDETEELLNNILFLIADFGKGKTSFLHHYASKLASQYLKSHEGLFPIYINLNEYDKYTNSPSLGIIANYLAKSYKIDIKEDYFKKKNYIFLIDSLDECGELTELNIDRVIKDIAEIQNLDNIHQRKNRLIIASRPIAIGLKEQISRYKPFCIKETDKKTNTTQYIENYISVYGFKKEQFDKYVEFALKKHLANTNKSEKDFIGISSEIFEKIVNNHQINLYSTLYNKVLKESELKRPIFAYMIYKLIISNSNFIDFGKVGVYISFLNQLSRDAKHKDDSNHKVSLKDEFVYRNILHSSALLWQYKRQSGEQTSLTKADICRTIEEKEIDKDDRKVLKEFNDIDSIHFLSHSYLGEKDNTLHFQHQSFAEILLAEYYLKVVIKYAIEENTDVEEARIRLSVGLPTDQTIDFFKGLLVLLKECVTGNPQEKTVFSKRELLIPLLASMAINKHNKKLYSTRLNATWFEKHEEAIFSKNKINDDIINDFPITQIILDKIEKLCYGIINSSKIYFLAEPLRHSVLYKNELMSVNNTEANFIEIDKWFALIAGNLIGTNILKRKFFNSEINAKYLFDMIRNWNYHEGYLPYWKTDLFIGINMKENDVIIAYDDLDISGVDFSYSYFRQLLLKNSQVRSCNFSDSTFDLFEINQSDISFTKFDNISIEESLNLIKGHRFEGYFSLTFCFFSQGVLFPRKLNDILKGNSHGIINYSSNYTIINCNNSSDFFQNYILPLQGLFEYIISKGIETDFILSSFKFEIDESEGLVKSKKNSDEQQLIKLISNIKKNKR